MTTHRKYPWSFQNIGGATRVKIQSGEDIRHLSELDEKMWTVLSCPIEGLEIDAQSMQYADIDGDGKIHVQEILATAKWLCDVLSDVELLCKSPASLPLSAINQKSEAGLKLWKSAQQIVKSLGKEAQELTKIETSDNISIFAQTKFNGDGIIIPACGATPEEQNALTAAIQITGGTIDRSGETGITAEQIEAFYQALVDYKAWLDAAVEAPFGDNTSAVMAAYQALDGKVQDFFMRSRLAAFDSDSIGALDVQVARIEAISAENLTSKMDEIASYPLARVTGKAEIDLSEAINPAWATPFNAIRTLALPSKQRVLAEADWQAIGDKLAAYTAWVNGKAGASVESLGTEAIEAFLQQDKKAALLALIEEDKALAEEAANIQQVDKLVHLTADFYTILKNFITLQDFYSTNKQLKAIFQAGTLIIDQRACHLCLRVTNMAAHNAMAAASGMYLIYCDCVRKGQAGTLPIVAAMTMGDTGDIVVGKHAIFYDRDGLDWDATVTKIIDNPISISQAFWSPYRRMSTWAENLINKRAAEKDAKVMGDLTTKLSTAPAAGTDTAAPTNQPFDIAKFAGIFAAFGMALGMIGSALVSVAKGFATLTWWQVILVFVGILLVISGPSMIMAWMKLRKRNLAPLLNANGWAVNASSLINLTFGNTLTDVAKFPKLKLRDPYAKKGLPIWKKWVISLSVILLFAGAGAAIWYFCFYKSQEVEVVEEKVECVTQEVETFVAQEAENLDSIPAK